MKCYEVSRCSEKDRSACCVWTTFRNHPEELEDCMCWVMSGTYHEDKERMRKCRKCDYYLTINRESAITVQQSETVAIVTCSGTVNAEKAEALARTWEALKKKSNPIVMLDIAKTNALYSCGLSVLVKLHREATAAGGMLIIVGGREHLLELFHTSKLSRIFNLSPDRETARRLIEAEVEKRAAEEEAARKTAEAARKAETEAEAARKAAEAARSTKPPAPKKFVRCWEYWNNRNPNNATACDECFHKQNPKARACWIVEGLIDGVTFHFVNESCLDCRYFEEFGKAPQG